MTHSKTKTKASAFDEELGNTVKSYRTIRNFSQLDLAQRLDITFQQVQKYENGSNRISAGTLHKMSDVLEVPIEEFFFPAKELRPSQENAIDQKEIISLLRTFSSIKCKKKRKIIIKFLSDLSKLQ